MDFLRVHQHYVGQACIDYRDVLAMAEYSEQLRHPYSLKEKDPERYARVVKDDLRPLIYA